MTTKKKLMLLELIAGVFGWGWMIAGAATLYFLVMAIGFDGTWTNFAIAVGVGVLCKWLARGFRDSQIRVAFEAKMIEAGMTPEEAGKAWMAEYNANRL